MNYHHKNSNPNSLYSQIEMDEEDEVFRWGFGFRGSTFIVLIIALALRAAMIYLPYSGIYSFTIESRSGKSSKVW